MSTEALLACCAATVVFVVSVIQTVVLLGSTSDHPVHVFLINAIRENRHRLFVRIPRIANDAYCSAYPLALHWLLSFVAEKRMRIAAASINGAANAAVVVTTYLIILPLSSSLTRPVGWGLAIVAIVFTPQYYHISNARNSGISARPVGVALFPIFWGLYAGFSPTDTSALHTVGIVLVAYMIWAFNTFATQALVLFAITWALLWRDPWPLAFAGIGLGMFLVVQRRYAVSYVTRTLLFMRSYALYLAPRFIFERRPSIWRDLVYDIWMRMRSSRSGGILYAYNNSVVVVVLLNPLFAIALLSALTVAAGRHASFMDQVVMVGAFVFVLTTVRPLRFLGEPERYVELIVPFVAVAGIEALELREMQDTAIGVVIYAVVLCGTQALLGYKVRARTEGARGSLAELYGWIARDSEGRGAMVCLASDNDQIVKRAMEYPWTFVRLWSADTIVAGYRIDEAISAIPYWRPGPFREAVKQYGVTHVILDAANPDAHGLRELAGFSEVARANQLSLLKRH
ncbi:MAG: hypothetical protein WC731_06100 [Candidatus Omnitrophota bacterium]